MTFDDVRVEVVGGGKAFRLPNRSTKQTRIAGAVMLGVGLFVTLFMIFWMKGPIEAALQMLTPGSGSGGSGGQVFGAFSLIFGLLGLPGLIIGFLLLIGGVALLSGRSRNDIVIDGHFVRSIERAGPLRWTFKRRRVMLHTIETGASSSGKGSSDAPPAILLLAERKKPLLIGLFYPRPLLNDLAATLGRELDLPLESALDDEETGEGRSAPPSRPAEDVPQPADSIVAVERREGELTLTFPPAGFKKATRGMFTFSLIWLGFITLFSALWVPAWLSAPGSDWLIAFFVLPFWVVGIVMLVATINMARRRAIIDVVGGTLLINRASMFGLKQDTIDAADITDIRVGPSGTEINNQPLNQLQVVRKADSTVGLLSERPDSELEWVASELRRALDI